MALFSKDLSGVMSCFLLILTKVVISELIVTIGMTKSVSSGWRLD